MDGNNCIEYAFYNSISHASFFASDSRGGICEKPAKDIYQGKRIIKTLNSGVITVINYNTRTSALVTELTFAHEVGHSLGAEV
jgi:disintegrin and metalloproteinase domain-containing protein 10